MRGRRGRERCYEGPTHVSTRSVQCSESEVPLIRSSFRRVEFPIPRHLGSEFPVTAILTNDFAVRPTMLFFAPFDALGMIRTGIEKTPRW